MWYTCLHCKKEFFKKLTKHKYKFCSHKCHSLSQIGKSTKRFEKIDRKGYWFIHKPNHPCASKQGYVSEQRLVMEKHIGRFTNRHEIIHHINRDKKDNRIENLVLYSSNSDHHKFGHPEHIKKVIENNKGKRLSVNTEFKKGNYPARWLKKIK